jgi:hypothetical protein
MPKKFDNYSYSNIPNPNKSLISANTSMNKSFTRGSKQKIFTKSHMEIKKRLESIDKSNIDILGSLIENEEEYKRGIYLKHFFNLKRLSIKFI